MKTVGFQSDFVILWHKHFMTHPVFDPKYARENIVSLVETLVMLFLYLSLLVLFLHWLVVLGFFIKGNIPWGMIEASTRILPFRPKTPFYNNPFGIFVSIVVTVGVIQVIKHSFELIKAEMHPKRNRVCTFKFPDGKPKLPPCSTSW